jgi:hydrogenase maturation protease
MRGYDGLVLVDASPRGEAPGTLYVIEPDEREVNADLLDGNFIDPHGGDPATVLRFIKALNAWPGKVVIVGCEPSNTEDFIRELSEPVAGAIGRAVILTEDIITEMINT